MEETITIKLNQDVAEKAKQIAKTKQLTLSTMVEQYFQAISYEHNHYDIDISPFVQSMSSGEHIPIDIDYKEEYSNYLAEKYK
ncbi:MAG: DUF6364 family protein [Ignavibacteria bacterium]|jgi:predicted transcriptional regulator|nr:DUF6364 family protein [Ignavibacteria bacterium]